MDIIIRPNEKIIKIFYTHKGRVNRIFLWAVVLLAGLVLIKQNLGFNFFGYWWQVFGVLILILISWFLVKWSIWRDHQLIVTNQRIVHVNQKSLFNKIVTDLLFKDIEEVSYEIKGLGESFSNYGTVRIQTGGEKDLVIDKILKPQKVVEIINNARK